MKKALVLAVLCASLATAADAQDLKFGDRWGTLSADIGLGASYGAIYPGAQDNEFSPWIVLRNASFGAPGKGDLDGFTILPSFGYAGERKESDDEALRGMGDISAAYEFGAQVSYGYGPVNAYVRTLQGFGGHHGITGEVGVRYRSEINDRLTLWSTLETTYGDSEFVETYFGVSGSQSLSSGNPVYEPGGGFTMAAARVTARYALGEKTALTGEVEYGRLIGDAADSPIVQDRNQSVIRLGITRNFSFGF
ncbi:MipA/OmpV family protein [Paracoccus marinaquae]|uniref:MipA/OmpV family protein n=1 Tax=Paracoccus marinaquae TaxID=2841926 RepID=A0ABS6ALE2_9RHOB|nr:MipA/OmpV family protein [Paracoccus marinaquae]MBU3031309.1 MipA/OmpV family protein [Paracoccus marinaquae]